MRSKYFTWGLSIAITAAIYVGGYGLARKRGWLVHRAGYAYGKVDHHDIAAGDPERLSGVENWLARSAYHLFTPVRHIETLYWYRKYPVGETWPY